MYDVVVIGCGITGAAIAYECSKYQLKVAVLEKENDVADGTTKANSAILHAGYDPKPGGLMAKLNVRGVALAKELCEKLDVPYRPCGSLVLAFDENDRKHIEKLKDQGDQNGVPGLAILEKEELKKQEPNLSDEVIAALWAPSAAIVSPWEYCLALAETAVKNGVELFRTQEVKEIQKGKNGFCVKTQNRVYETKFVVNCAGIHADQVHAMVEEPDYEIKPRRGQYYLLDKSEGSLVHSTIFQCPNEKGKGVLVSPTVHGNLIVGPDAEFVDDESTGTTTAALDFIRDTARRSVPDVRYQQSIRNFAGLRAYTAKEDFILKEAETVPGFFDAAGICSPGLSAAPAIAEYMVAMMAKRGLSQEKKENFIDRRKKIRFKELTGEERAELVRQHPEYGRVICRCETITEGEIMASFTTPIPPVSVDGVKRRVNAGMGRCQGGFCGPRVAEILSKRLGVPMTQLLQDREGTRLLMEETKQGGAENV